MDLLIAAAELIEKFDNAGLDKIGKAEYLEMIEKGGATFNLEKFGKENLKERDESYSSSLGNYAELREDHGYASSSPKRFSKASYSKLSRSKNKYSPERNQHNILEKDRRAKLRNSLDVLKDVLPLSDARSFKYTTLSLLNTARRYIQKLEEDQSEYLSIQIKLRRNQKTLKNKLQMLNSRQASSGVFDDGFDNDCIDVVECCDMETSDSDSLFSNSSASPVNFL
jgi:hypothetical protein